MSPFTALFWPSVASGLVAGVAGGLYYFREYLPKPKRQRVLGIAIAAGVAGSQIWLGPMGGAERFIAKENGNVRKLLDYYEMVQVQGHLARGPLSRTVLLSGPADDLQQSELVRMTEELQGIGKASWNKQVRSLPLFVESAIAALLGLAVGLFLSWLAALHRRYNAQWNW